MMYWHALPGAFYLNLWAQSHIALSFSVFNTDLQSISEGFSFLNGPIVVQSSAIITLMLFYHVKNTEKHVVITFYFNKWLGSRSYQRFESPERSWCCTPSLSTPAGCRSSSSPLPPRGSGSPTGQRPSRAKPAAGCPSSPPDSKQQPLDQVRGEIRGLTGLWTCEVAIKE